MSKMPKGVANGMVSVYANVKAETGLDWTIHDVLQHIKTDEKWKARAEYVRLVCKGEDPKEYARRKELAEGFTICGTFGKHHKGDTLRNYSGFIGMDLDALEDLEATVNLLKKELYVYSVFRSIGGKGLCVIIRINPDRFADAYISISQHWLKKFGLVTDKQCSDISRFRFISYDPELYLNESSTIWKDYLPAKEKKRLSIVPAHTVHSDQDTEHIVSQIEAAQIDIAPGYEDWYRVGWSLISQYGQDARALLHRISQFSGKYDFDDCEKKFGYLINTDPKGLTIATFYYLAKQAGLSILTEQTKEIVRQANNAKRNKMTQSGAVEQLSKMENISPEISAPIVKQVFESATKIAIEESETDELETFLRLNYPMKRNLITRYIEDEAGANYDETGFNSIYRAAKKAMPKLNYNEMERIIKSDFTTSYNPLKDWFRVRAHLPCFKKTGLIERWADCIITDTGGVNDPGFARFFLRKWLIGMVGSVYGKHCPLVVVLTGKPGTGKTQFWRTLLPEQLRQYYGETKFDDGKDDEILMTKKLLLMNDEFGGNAMKNPERFKSLTSKQTFNLREPYGRGHVDLERLSAICGTTNEKRVLNDPTGNRRIIPLNVLKILFAQLNEIEREALIMEAYHALQAGESCDLTAVDMERLNAATDEFEELNLERELLLKYYEPGRDADKFSMVYSASEVKVTIEKATGQKLGLRRLGIELKRLTGEESAIHRINDKVKRGYFLREL